MRGGLGRGGEDGVGVSKGRGWGVGGGKHTEANFFLYIHIVALFTKLLAYTWVVAFLNFHLITSTRKSGNTRSVS